MRSGSSVSSPPLASSPDTPSKFSFFHSKDLSIGGSCICLCIVYSGAKDLPRILGNLGIAIISTSQGLMTDAEARKLKVGGEVLCYIW